MGSAEPFGAETLRTETPGSGIQEELCFCARAATAAQCSTKPFNLRAQQCLCRAECAAGWEPWLCLASCSQVGLSQGKPSQCPCAGTAPLCQPQVTLQCSLPAGTRVFLFCPSRPCLWSHLTKIPHQFGDKCLGIPRVSPVRVCRVWAQGGELGFGAGSPKGVRPSSTQLSINYCQVSWFNP